MQGKQLLLHSSNTNKLFQFPQDTSEVTENLAFVPPASSNESM